MNIARIALGLTVAGCALAITLSDVPAIGAASKPGWSATVSQSEIGGYVIGNPAAATKVVEYISYTCNHCADFETNGSPVLKSQYIAKGTVSAEIRNMVRDPADMAAALLARCGGKTRFVGNHAALMAAQSVWLGKVTSAPKDVQASWFQGTVPERLTKIANGSGMMALMQKRGFTAAQLKTCLASEPEQKKILAMTKYATDTLQVSGTPSFTMNGKLLDHVHNWAALKAKLDTL